MKCKTEGMVKNMKTLNQVHQKAYHPGSGFIGRYQKKIKDIVIPYQYRVLLDEEPSAPKSHVIQNFVNAGKALRGEDIGDGFYGMVFQDSDGAKWLEAAAYALALFPDEKLEAMADDFIDKIVNAQDLDGYLNTYFTIKDKEKRWENLMEAHELYSAGHMMEAACAYYEATGKDKLLRVMLRNAMHIYDVFIVQGKEGYPGHPEIELALMKMYRLTGEKKCLELAEHFIDVRGADSKYFEKESRERTWHVWCQEPFDALYAQFDKPVREQCDAVGHAVRAVYLYTAMADMAAESDDEELCAACSRLWDSIVNRRMYVTGGIGSTVIGEAFTVDYDLPNDTAYAETCASIGLIFFASRMLEMSPDSKYADVMERAFYNTVLAGMQLDGTKFFYVNPLEVVPGISGVAATHQHDLPERPKWYGCACCPPNTARLISSLGQYAYGENADTAYCHLYADGEITFKNGMKILCKTNYPYEFTVVYDILEGSSQLAVRIPAWSRTYKLEKNGQEILSVPQKGYVYLDAEKGDCICLTLDDKPYYVYPSAKIPELTGCVAVCRGPLVYCFEGVDNENDVLSLMINDNGRLDVMNFDDKLLEGTVQIAADAVRMETDGKLYSVKPPAETICKAIAVPYYTWGNRGLNQMRVWMTRK